MTHYATLGVAENASSEEIKRAYRKLASQHHPDKGGDTKRFQEIQTAYDAVSDDAKRAQYDAERQNPGGFRFTVNGQPHHDMHGGMEDILRGFGFNFGGMAGGDPFGHVRQPRRNKDLRVDIPITLASTLEEQTKTISVQTTNGHRETVEVTIPRGVFHGTQIKYPGLGDNLFNTLARGDLYVHFSVHPDPTLEVAGLDLIKQFNIDCLDAITGTEIEVKGLDDNKFVLTIPPGIQNGMMLRIANHGLWQLHSSQRGHLLVKIAVTVPRNLTVEQLDLIKQIKNTQ